MQPTFMPWQGYFALIDASDCFVFLDDFQFCRRSFDQRNRILYGDGSASWITVPVIHGGSDRRGAFNEVVPQLDATFRRKMLATFRSSYSQASFFDGVFPEMEAWLAADRTSVADLNIDFIKRVTAMLGYEADFRLSSAVSVEGKRSARLEAILRAVGARTYLSARGAFDYMLEEGIFPLEGVTTVFQNFVPQPYPQLQSSRFVSHLSVLDALFQIGPEQTRTLITQGQQGFVPWSEMVSGCVSK